MLKLLRGIIRVAAVVATIGELVLNALGSRQTDQPPPQ
jgi:hypothetical protein